MAKVQFRILDRKQVMENMPSLNELLEVVSSGLNAHGRGNVVLPPKAHIELDDRYNGHFNILVGWSGSVDAAGVKVIGDYVDNYKHGLPSEVAMLTLYDPRIGVPIGLMDATDITTWRTGAVTAIGARHLSPRRSRILGHIGARGSAFPNIALLSRDHDFEEIRVHSRRPESRERLAKRLRDELQLNAIAVDSAEAAVRDADIVVEATRMERPQVLIRDEWLKSDCLLITYGWQMAVDPKTVLGASKIVVDDWRQCCVGGALHPMIATGELTTEMIHGEIGQVVAGLKPGRSDGDGRIVYWHRGFAISDIVLGHNILQRANANSAGQMFTLFDGPDE